MSWGFGSGRGANARAFSGLVLGREGVSGVEVSAAATDEEITPEGASKIGRGSGGSKTARRLILPVLLVSLGALIFMTTPALAETPETPETGKANPASVTATTATLEDGVLNPHAALGELAEYEYRFKVSATECEGESGTAGMAAGEVNEVVSPVELTNLQPNVEYTFCLVERSLATGETSPASTPAHFTTKPAPATIDSASVSNIKSSEATLEGTVNPNNQFTECHFQYGSSSVEENTIPCSPEQLKGYGEQSVSPTKSEVVVNYEGNPEIVTVPSPISVSPGTEYKYQIVTKNGDGEESNEEKTFKTAEEPEKQPAEQVKGTEATLKGVLNPHSEFEAGTYEFLYKQSAGECQLDEAERNKRLSQSATPAEPSTTASPQPVSATIAGLQPGATYTFCLLERNSSGQQAAISALETFTTLAAAPTVAGESASRVTATEATLNAQIDPNGAETHYYFQYGTTEAYGASTPLTELEGSLTATDAAIATVTTGLEPGTTYHYRVVATNSQSPGGIPGEAMTFTTPETPTTAETCPNAQVRAEQPSGSGLPDCRAYEMVSPPETNGQDATHATSLRTGPRAAPSGEAIAYASAGSFGGPSGAGIESELVSRRNAEKGRWETQNITPPLDPRAVETESSYETLAFTPDLGEGLAITSASLTSEAPTPTHNEFDLYLADFATGQYRYVAETPFPMGASTDLSRVVTGEQGEVSEWLDGSTVPVSVGNEEGESLSASVGNEANSIDIIGLGRNKDTWHAVSGDGTRVYFTSPASLEGALPGVRQLYVRVNVGQRQSPLAGPEANGTGTLTKGSNAVASLVTAAASIANAHRAPSGSTELLVETGVGRFVVGQPISAGSAIAPGTTITSISDVIVEGGFGGKWTVSKLTLSRPTVANLYAGELVSSAGPAPFVVGQSLSGNGISPGTTIEALAAGSLTLSKPAVSSGGAVELRAGGECAVPADACTVDVSASQRQLENPAGPQPARYWGASADGSKVFFTSNAELTEEAYTGPHGEGANLYEYDLQTGKLNDLTGEETDASGEGAAVQGVVQISEAGQYIYFVAKGALAAGGREQQCRAETEGEQTGTEPKQDNLGCNLYVVHEGGAPVFVATLAYSDRLNWTTKESEAAGPVDTTAVVSPGGGHLAFVSGERLKTVNFPEGYDNEQAHHGECEANLHLRANYRGEPETEAGRCREIYIYDAEGGGLLCASCDPTGARPVGPSGLPEDESFAEYRPRDLLEDGTLFFDSSDTLVPNASGGQRNVYENEGGHVYAISDVAGAHESFFMDASADGSDVFFATSDDLVPQDTGANVVVYDARVEGGFPASSAPSACSSSDTCLPPSSPQPGVFGAAGSATFSGPGNVVEPATVKGATKPETRAQKLAKALRLCRKKKVKRRRVSCERVARQRYGPLKAKKGAAGKVGGERRAGR